MQTIEDQLESRLEQGGDEERMQKKEESRRGKYLWAAYLGAKCLVVKFPVVIRHCSIAPLRTALGRLSW